MNEHQMERHFSEQEVSEIIRRAADHQVRERPSGAPAAPGVSESELKRVASELGIEASALQAAISEVGSGALGDTGTLDSVQRVLERSIEGELSPDELGIVLEEFTPVAEFGSHGPVSIGNSLTYNSVVGLTPCNINVAARNGKTRLRVKSNALAAALATFLPVIVISFVGNLIYWKKVAPPIDDGILFATLLPVAFLVAAFFGFRKLVRFGNRKILDLTNRTAAKLAESSDHLRGNLSRSGIPIPEVEASAEETRLQ